MIELRINWPASALDPKVCLSVSVSGRIAIEQRGLRLTDLSTRMASVIISSNVSRISLGSLEFRYSFSVVDSEKASFHTFFWSFIKDLRMLSSSKISLIQTKSSISLLIEPN